MQNHVIWDQTFAKIFGRQSLIQKTQKGIGPLHIHVCVQLHMQNFVGELLTLIYRPMVQSELSTNVRVP